MSSSCSHHSTVAAIKALWGAAGACFGWEPWQRPSLQHWWDRQHRWISSLSWSQFGPTAAPGAASQGGEEKTKNQVYGLRLRPSPGPYTWGVTLGLLQPPACSCSGEMRSLLTCRNKGCPEKTSGLCVSGLFFFFFSPPCSIFDEISQQQNTWVAFLNSSKELEGLFCPEGRAPRFSPYLFSSKRRNKKEDIKN